MADASGLWSALKAAAGRPAGGLWGATAVLALIAVVGCSQGNEQYGPPTGGTGAGTGTGTGYGGEVIGNVEDGDCGNEGEVRPCHVLLGQHDDIVNCYYGVQRCVFGSWTKCQDGEYAIKSIQRPLGGPSAPPTADVAGPTLEKTTEGVGHVSPFAGVEVELAQPMNAAATSCKDLCDPTCQKFSETQSFTVAGQSLTGWAAPGTAALPGKKSTYLNKLWTEPCAQSSDCQWGMYCNRPVTLNQGTGAGQCAHDKCAVGSAMSATCGDPCVAAVCAADSTCCTYTGSCAHAPCVTGAELACQASDTCVAAVCSNPGLAYCCDPASPQGWDASCVAAYGTCTGRPCPDPNRPWDAGCTRLVHDVCGLACVNETPACEHDLCATGAGLTYGCDAVQGNCSAAVCAAMPSCCGVGGSWTQACIDAIPANCGKACPGAVGQCTQRIPNEVDAECGGADLVVRAPCYDGAINSATNYWGNACGGACPKASGVACDPATNKCASGCFDNTDCAWGYTCYCQPTGPNTAVCGSASQTCPVGYTCTTTANTMGQCQTFSAPGKNAPGAYVVVCNAGTSPTPKDTPVTVNVYHNAGVLSSWPASPGGAPATVCTSADIDPVHPPQVLPGKCIDIPCVTTQYDSVYVNPPGASHLTECDGAGANNWAYNIDASPTNHVSCSFPQCSMTTVTTRSLPSHLVFEVENSTLTGSALWAKVQTGFSTYGVQFASTPWSNALVGAKLGIFPDSTTSCTTSTCGAAPPKCVSSAYGTTQSISSTVSSTAFAGAGKNPPYVDALQGALEAARLDQQTQSAALTACSVNTDCKSGSTCTGGMCTCNTNADCNTGVCSGGKCIGGWNEAVVFVMTSDVTAAGHNYCGSTLTALTGLAAQYYAQYGIRTHVLGVGNASYATAATIAAAGHGMGFHVADDASTANNVKAMLNYITTYNDQVCSFPLPTVDLFDMSNAKVLIASSPMTTPTWSQWTTVTQVTHAGAIAPYNSYLEACLADCPGTLGASPTTSGWCYDDPTTPTKIVLCPNTCQTMLFDPYASNSVGGYAHAVGQIQLGCPSYYDNLQYPSTGAYQGVCPAQGQKALWSYLSYDTVQYDAPNAVCTSKPCTTNADCVATTGKCTNGACECATGVTFKFQTADFVNGSCPAASSFPAPNAYTVTAGKANPQVCSLGQGNGCPVDLVQQMNGGSLTGPMLSDCMKMSVLLNPNAPHTVTPTVNKFELRYSCPFVE